MYPRVSCRLVADVPVTLRNPSSGGPPAEALVLQARKAPVLLQLPLLLLPPRVVAALFLTLVARLALVAAAVAVVRQSAPHAMPVVCSVAHGRRAGRSTNRSPNTDHL